MPQIQITVSQGVLKALQHRAQREDVSVIDLIRSSMIELADDGVSDEVRAIIEKSIAANKRVLDRLAEGPRTYHNVDER